MQKRKRSGNSLSTCGRVDSRKISPGRVTGNKRNFFFCLMHICAQSSKSPSKVEKCLGDIECYRIRSNPFCMIYDMFVSDTEGEKHKQLEF